MPELPRNPKVEPAREKLRAVGLRLLFLVGLVLLGTLLTYRNSPLNIINLFNRPVSDPETVGRVQEQQSAEPEQMATQEVAGETLTLPDDFAVTLFASGRGKLRMMAITADNYLLVTEMDRGNVLAYPLTGASSEPVTLVSGLRSPSGVAFHNNEVWVAEETRVTKYPYQGNGRVGDQTVVIPAFPDGGHGTRTIGFGLDGKLYVTIGSSCNVCEEKDQRRAAMVRYNADGTGEEIFAEGLRNTVPFIWHPESGEIWGADNGRDLIGDDVPPEEINIIKQSKHYGWPYCYGRGVPNPEFPDKAEFCQSTEFPIVEMQAHSAPLGMRFYEDGNWPDRYDLNLFIGFHGSWNRTDPTGYKIVRVDRDLKVHDFITGWQEKPLNRVWGRPVDILFFDDDMYVTDDFAGRIFKVSLKD